MFGSVLNGTPLYCDAANNYFSNITSSGYEPDKTFISTLRALLAGSGRIGEDNLFYSYSRANYPAYKAESLGSEAPSRLLGSWQLDNQLLMYEFNSNDSASNEAWMNAMEKYLPDAFPSYSRIERVTKFFEKSFRVLCFASLERKSTVIFVTGIEMKHFHYLQCAIPAFLPWYFNAEKGLSQEERELIDSLLEPKPGHYISILQKIADRLEIGKRFIRDTLGNFLSKQAEQECNTVRSEINSILNEIETLRCRISDYARQHRALEMRLAGYMAQMAGDEKNKELVDYFASNDSLELLSAQNSHIKTMIRGYLTYFNDDFVETLLDGSNSYLYRPNGRSYEKIIPDDDIALLMRAIFIDRVLRVRVCAAVDINVSGFRASHTQYNYGMITDYTPNPHLYHHNCFGGNEDEICKYLRNGDIVSAMEQVIASVFSITTTESTTFSEFMVTLYTGDINNNCIELPNGAVVNPKAAIQYLKEEKANGEAD